MFTEHYLQDARDADRRDRYVFVNVYMGVWEFDLGLCLWSVGYGTIDVQRQGAAKCGEKPR